MKNITVMHLLKSKSYSGAENVVCQIIRQFKEQPNIRMVYVSHDGPIRETLGEYGIEFYGLNSFSRMQVEMAVRQIKPDIIHAHDFSASVIAATISGVKVISHLHCNPLWFSKVNLKTLVYVISSIRFYKVIGVSEAVKNEFIFSSFIKRKYLVLPNIVDVETIKEKAEEIIVDEPVDVAYVGRLVEEKNPMLFLNIVKELVDREIGIHAVMIGEGELKAKCERFIDENNLAENIKLFGFLKNPYPWMKKAKVAVIPSKVEGFGLVAVEAILLGTPVVCSGIGGLRDIVNSSSRLSHICERQEDYILSIEEIIAAENTDELMKHEIKCVVKNFCDKRLYKKKLFEIYSN